MRNRFVANLATIAMLGSGLSLLASPAHAQTQPALEAESKAFVNEQRRQRDLANLTPDAQLMAAARRHAERMAADAEIYHNANLGNEVDGFERLGENVGVGWSVDAIDDAFMASDGHRVNILGSFTRLGLGVVEREGDIYIVQVFGKPAPKAKPNAAEPKRKAKHKHNHKKHHHSKPKPRPSSTPTPEPQPTTSAEPEPTPSQEPTPSVEPTPSADPTLDPTPDPTFDPSPDPTVTPTEEPADPPSPQPTAGGGKSFPLPGWLTR